MLVQIQPVQIPDYWEVIKYAATQSDNVEEKYLEVYSITLLQDLLSSKKNCFLAQEGEVISFIAILEFRVDSMKGFKYIYFNNLYSFNKQDEDVWKNVFADLYTVAMNNDCKAIIGDSDNDRVANIIYSTAGIRSVSKKFAYYL